MKILPLVIGVQSVGAVVLVAVVATQTLGKPPPKEARKPAAAENAHDKSAAPAAHAEAPGANPADVVKELREGNERFVSGVTRRHDMMAERNVLAKGQHPQAIVLSCSDSRVAPELVFDKSLGELFVVRNAGNVAEAIGLASMEYAAEHLGSTVLMVLGHEKCGAVTAASGDGHMPTSNLEALVSEIRPGIWSLKGKYEGAELVHLGVEANVRATAAEVLERSPALAARVKAGKLTLVQGVYDLDSGRVRMLDPANAPEAPAAPSPRTASVH